MNRGKRRFFVPSIVIAVIGACFVGIWFLSADARREIDALATANADSTQWSIAQTEVELLTLEAAVLNAMHDNSQAALRDVRRRFDVFFPASRCCKDHNSCNASARKRKSPRRWSAWS